MINGMEIHCPKCGRTSSYSTPDFHAPEGSLEEEGDVSVEDRTSEYRAKQELQDLKNKATSSFLR